MSGGGPDMSGGGGAASGGDTGVSIWHWPAMHENPTPHSRPAGATHRPEPLQLLGATSRPFTQPCGAQVTEVPCRRQPPRPLQPPERPHVEVASAGQSLPGSVPSATGVQVPTEPAMLHE